MNGGTLRLLVHMYCFAPSVTFENAGSKEHQAECRRRLVDDGLITFEDDAWALTEKGRVHVEALLNAALPEEKWISPVKQAVDSLV